MNDLISRQDAVTQLSHNKIGDDDCDVIIQRDIETIKQLPSAEPQIIRCKDCKHRDKFGCCKHWEGWAQGDMPIATDDNDFCSYAEQR